MTTLYDKDFQLWIEQTIASLKSGEFNSLDVDHLIEELQELGKSEKQKMSILLPVPFLLNKS